MRITKQLLMLILAKHKEEFKTNLEYSEVFEYDNDYAIRYNKKVLPFEKEWLNADFSGNVLIPTDKKIKISSEIKEALNFLNIKADLYQTNFKDRYITFDTLNNSPEDFDLKDLDDDVKELFYQARKQYKNVIDEFAYKDRITRLDAHRQNQIYIRNDETSDLVYIDTVSNPKIGCASHQGRIHSKSGKDKSYPSLQQAYDDGFQFPNCRHSARPYYEGLTKLPNKETGKYEGSTREKEVQNSAKIRRLNYQLETVTDDAKIKQIKEKISNLKKDGYMKYRI